MINIYFERGWFSLRTYLAIIRDETEDLPRLQRKILGRKRCIVIGLPWLQH